MTYNSTSWKPGQSGNPKGKAKGARDKRHMFNEELMLSFHEVKNGYSDAFRIMDVIKTHALQGNMKACALFCQYVFFKPEANITISHQATNEDIDNVLTPEQIKKIAEITLSSSDESE